jgi:hypothetical protein
MVVSAMVREKTMPVQAGLKTLWSPRTYPSNAFFVLDNSPGHSQDLGYAEWPKPPPNSAAAQPSSQHITEELLQLLLLSQYLGWKGQELS